MTGIRNGSPTAVYKFLTFHRNWKEKSGPGSCFGHSPQVWLVSSSTQLNLLDPSVPFLTLFAIPTWWA